MAFTLPDPPRPPVAEFRRHVLAYVLYYFTAFAPTWANLEATCAKLKYLGRIWGQLEANLVQLGPTSAQLEAIWCQLGAKMEPI